MVLCRILSEPNERPFGEGAQTTFRYEESTMDISWSDSSKLQRKTGDGHLEIPDFQVPSGDPIQPCGVVRIHGRIEESGLAITLSFEAAEEPGCECCREYGWIQHELTRAQWRFDNGTLPSTGPMRQGGPSDPDKNPQGSDSGERWDPNPWYGGSGNVKDAKAKEIRDTKTGAEEEDALDELDKKFERNPEPQTTIRDAPGFGAYIAQLVCVESGNVVFQYRYAVTQKRGERIWKFIGSEGTNLTFSP